MKINKFFLFLFCVSLVACKTPWYKLKSESAQLRENLSILEAENIELRAQLDKAGITITETEGQLQRLRDAQRSRDQELMNLQSKLKGTGVEARIEDGQAILVLPNKIFFTSGQHTLTKNGRKALETVAKVIKDQYKDFKISVEGHTDSDPIVKSRNRYADNYQLSAERSRTVLLIFESKGIDSKRLKGCFHGPNQPVVPNSSKANKRKNRRVEIILYP